MEKYDRYEAKRRQMESLDKESVEALLQEE